MGIIIRTDRPGPSRPHGRWLLACFGLVTVLEIGMARPEGLAQRQPQLPSNELPYRDASLPIELRVDDLLRRMTLEEKAGQLFHTQITIGPNGTLAEEDAANSRNSTVQLVTEMFMTHFNLLGNIENATVTAQWHNRLQRLALQTRLGIPVTLSTDPRNAFTENVGTSFQAGRFSQWPESLGLAALRSPALVQEYADVLRQEYTAVGLRVALHPQIDVATEPRWARVGGTMGENANLTSELAVAYIRGFQGQELGAHSVATVAKHFPGGGPCRNGEDPHFTYGKDQVYPGNNLDYHLIPFRAAIAAGARQIMPSYAKPVGTQYEEVAFAFNKGIITDLVRGELGFDRIILTDWGLITDTFVLGQYMPARAWGLENTTELERTQRILEAGCDQFGGESRPELIVELVNNGIVPEARLDVSIRKLLREKFILGLFDNPFVDTEAAGHIVGNAEFAKLGNETQRRAYTLLTNKDAILPLASTEGKKFYIEGFNESTAEARGLTVVKTPAEADLALLRLRAPYEPRPGGFEAFFHTGSLEFSADERARQAAIYESVPTIVDLYLDRPAAVPEIVEAAAALLVSFGSSADAFLDVVVGAFEPEGKLPFDLPRSMRAVNDSYEDVPFDTFDPVFRFGHGLGYS